MRRAAKKRREFQPFTARLFLLGLFFCVGLTAGLLACRIGDDPSRVQLAAYLRRFCGACAEHVGPAPFGRVVFSYLRGPVLIILLGICAYPSLLIPLACAAQSFSLSFSAGSFVLCLGREGVLLALCAFGLRSVVCVPCTLYLAALGMQDRKPVAYRREDLKKVCFCLFCLVVGILLEIILTPKLFQWIC